MGMDIYAFIEVKIAGQWCYLSDYGRARNGDMFGCLAGWGEDDEDTPILFGYKGIAPDLSVIGQAWVDAGLKYGGYDFSWLTFDEMLYAHQYALKKDYKEFLVDAPLCGFPIIEWKEHPRTYYPPGLEDVRLVFWFNY
jgi:hypothetical protein